jgi:hypothetical protein
MREREQWKRRDELFDEIKPRTLPKQELRWKQTPQHSTIEPAAGGQTMVLDGQITADSVPGGQTAPSGSPTTPSGGQTTRAQEGHSLIANTTDQVSSMSGQPGSQTVSPAGQTTNSYSPTVRPPAPVSPTAISSKIGTDNGVDGTSSPTAMEEDTDDDLLYY